MEVHLKKRIKNSKDTVTNSIHLSVLLLVVVSISGCYQRKLSPETQYSLSDSDLISEQIESFDWE